MSITGQNRFTACIAGLLLAVGCNNGEVVPGGFAPGPVTIAITDAASNDIEVFEVDVTAIQLRRANSSTVSILSAPVRVDLASLTSTSKLLASVRAPFGSYTGATVTMDLSSARCLLVGQIEAATILVADISAPSGTITVPLQLSAPFTVSINAHRLLELDFDLDQSFSVDAGANSVVLEPSFLLRVDPIAPKSIATIATLASVSSSDFVGEVHALDGSLVSTVVFTPNAVTVFQIDGVILTGGAGLTALAALPVDTSIQCFGSVTSGGPGIDVSYVEAGSGTYDGGTDIVEGHIVGRTGGVGSDAVFEVLGHSNDAAHTTFVYGTTFLVNTSFANTKVVRRGSAAPFDVDDLNVGQLVRVYGTLSGTTMSANTATSVIRMQPTRVFGAAAGAPIGTTLTLAITRVGGLADTAFNWSNGGFTPVDPNAFRANIGALGVGQAINSTSSVTVLGYFSEIADAGPDFTANALVNQSTAPALLFVRNDPNVGFTVLTTANASQIQLGVVGPPAVGEFALVDRGLLGSIPLPTGPTPTVNHPSVTGFYSLRDRTSNTVRIFARFSDFASALQSDIVQGATLIQLGALGTYTQAINSIDAGIATAVVE